MAVHKGNELSNINETWNQNERQSQGRDSAGDANSAGAGVGEDLKQVIKEEAAEYDNANKEERTLGGERATVRDDGNNASGDE